MAQQNQQIERTPEATAIVKSDTDYNGLTMVASPAEAKRRLQQLQAFIKEVMVEGEDYGVIPGTKKPTLLQPGAQKLAEIYGFIPDLIVLERVRDWERMFFFDEIKCVLTSQKTGLVAGVGIGSCNSRESRYAYRWIGDRDLPPGTDKSKLESRENSGKYGKWRSYKVHNEDLASIVNTVTKMACKRAYVMAVIGATRSAGIFTQDAEDLPPEAFTGEPREEEPKAETSQPSHDADKPTPAQNDAALKRFNELAAADDLEVLRRLWLVTEADIKSGHLHQTHRDALKTHTNRRKKELSAEPSKDEARS
jgi:hypothetical protein